MAFADTAVRNVVQGNNPIKVALEAACEVGDLLAFGTTGWVLADASDDSLPATLIAGERGAAGQTITAFQSAVVEGPTGMTPGKSLYLSDTGGDYSDSTGSVTQVVGIANTATQLLANPAAISAEISDIAAGTVVNADVADAAAIAFSKLAALDSANILVGSATNVATKRAVTGDVTIGNTGVTAIGAGVIVNDDISATAAIALSKLADVTDGYIVVGSSEDVPTAVEVTGDVTITNDGVTAIGAGKVTAAMQTETAKLRTVKTSVQDIDTIGAADYDEVILVPSTGIKITGVRIVYDKEQSGTVAGGGVKVGTAAGGEQIVAATALENTKAVGYCKVCTLVEDTVAANTPIFVRITGVAATQAGAVHVEMDYYTTDIDPGAS